MPQPGPANVNVSIRVLSPGDNGPVNQTNTAPAPDPAAGPSGEPSWIWAWTFDWCGTITELSTLAGEGTGLDWVWTWDWTWDCRSSGVPIPGDTSPGDTSPDPVDTVPPAQSAPTTTMPDASGGNLPPTTSVPSPIVAPEWITRVSWAIPSAGPSWLPTQLPFEPFAAPWDEASWPAPLVVPPIDIAVDVTIPSVVPGKLPLPAQPTVVVETGGGLQIVIDVRVPLSLPTLVPAGHVPAPRPDARRTRAADPHPGAARPESSTATSTSLPDSWSAPTTTRSVPRTEATATASPRRDARTALPFGPSQPLLAGGSAPASGGSVPSLLTFGLATIIGFFVFAAPGLGRRIRLARIPSPRSRSHSPLDRPG